LESLGRKDAIMRNLSWLALFPTQVKRAEEKRVTQTEARAGLCRDKIVAVSTTLPVNIPRFLRKVQSQQPWSRASSGIPFADHSLFLSSCAHSFIFTERALAVTMDRQTKASILKLQLWQAGRLHSQKQSEMARSSISTGTLTL
jgi:hypothetical protein